MDCRQDPLLEFGRLNFCSTCLTCKFRDAKHRGFEVPCISFGVFITIRTKNDKTAKLDVLNQCLP